MRRKLVAGNWKMHGSRQSVAELLQQIRASAQSLTDEVEVAVCPAMVHLPLAQAALVDSKVVLGAQNVYCEDQGAFTGEVSAPMLAEFSVKYVIVGHSERRQLFGETSQLVADKFLAVQAAKMVPILCLGESLEQREKGATKQVVLNQLDAVIEKAGVGAFSNAVIAYEPIWAIGTGKTASPAQAQEVHENIRAHIRRSDEATGSSIRILYGGSVNAANAEEIFAQKDIDGGLVGGASLKAAEFTSIFESAS